MHCQDGSSFLSHHKKSAWSMLWFKYQLQKCIRDGYSTGVRAWILSRWYGHNIISCRILQTVAWLMWKCHAISRVLTEGLFSTYSSTAFSASGLRTKRPHSWPSTRRVLYAICIVCDECWKCHMMRNPMVWISIPVKPLRCTTTCKCCTVYQIHVCQFNPCVTFHVFRNSQTSPFCLQVQSHWTNGCKQSAVIDTECYWAPEVNKRSDSSNDKPLLDWKECLSVSLNPFL